MNIAIIDYGSGNLRSVAKAFERAAAANASQVKVISQAAALKEATHIVLPGVGAFGDCMRGLLALPGMRDALEEEVMGRQKPFLGICVGMQLMFDKGYEHGEHDGLGWIKGEIRPIEPKNPQDKIPHMGWNDLILDNPKHPMLHGVAPGEHAYFVHSYHAQCKDARDVVASVEYGGQSITAVVGREQLQGTQFHPEKSQETGLKLIGNFLTL